MSQKNIEGRVIGDHRGYTAEGLRAEKPTENQESDLTVATKDTKEEQK